MLRRSHDEPAPEKGEKGEATEVSSDPAATPAENPDAAAESPGPAHASDALDVLADEIASTLRATKEACRRIEAQAEEHAAHIVEEAGAQAEALVAEAEAHAKAQLEEAETVANANRDEAQQLLDEATRSRDAAEATLARTRKLLADAESELARSIEQASTVRAALEAIKVEAASVEQHPSDPVAAASGPTGEEVIDLTEGASGGEDLDAPLRDAVARAVEDASKPQEPSG